MIKHLQLGALISNLQAISYRKILIAALNSTVLMTQKSNIGSGVGRFCFHYYNDHKRKKASPMASPFQ